MSEDPTITPPADPEPTPPAPAEDRTFKQEDVDRIVRDRLARQKAQFSDYEDLQAKASQFDELQQASKTELQKATERADAAEKAKKDFQERVTESLLRSAVVVEATKRDVDADVAVAMIDRGTIEFDDTGTPTNIASVMDSLLEAKPFLAGQTTTPKRSADLGARPGATAKQATRDELARMSDADYEQARKDGRLKAFGIG